MKHYHVVRNILDQQTINLVKYSMLIMKNTQYYVNKVPIDNHSAFADGNPVDHDCWGTYASPVTEALLLECLPVAEKAFDVKLHPAFSFCRIYWTGSDMFKHKDRPSCEYSISLNISNDPEPWPIYFEGEPVVLHPGDGVLYEGCKAEHWRETFTGREQFQVFLHYINQNGPFASEALDGRPMLGLKFPHSA